MAEAIHLISARNINQVFKPHQLISSTTKTKPPKRLSLPPTTKISAASKKSNDFSLNKKMRSKSPRHLIIISTSDGRWHTNWTSEYLVSLQDLKLEDLVEDEHKNADVFVSLAIQKHASFGFSVDGRIITSFTRKCSNCSSPYCRKIDTGFNVWVLQSSRDSNSNNIPLPEIGGDDPSVIYVKPGYQAELDSLVQDTIRLTTIVKDTCSETCEKSEPIIQYIGAQNSASIDKRWGRLLELRNANP